MVQVLLVTGGYDGDNYLSSTETHVSGADKWNLVGNLPTPVQGLREVYQIFGQLIPSKLNMNIVIHSTQIKYYHQSVKTKLKDKYFLM